MQLPSDAELLAEWTARRSEAAFARLVERYVALVHSAARRQVSDPHLAEEITQAVFILLARKAGSLSPQTVLAGWLCRTAHFAARDVLKAERRRQHREQLAATMDTTPDAAWQQLAPLLDEAVAQLREADRNAIVLRYYEKRSLDEVGAALGIGADAAQKRVTRALEKLRDIFAKRGVTLTGAAIAGAVSANAIQAVPVALAAKISSAALVAGTTLATTLVMTTMQKAIIGATLALAVGTGLYEARQAANARSEVQMLKQQQVPLTEEIHQLTRERDEAMRRSGSLYDAADQQRIRKEHLELLSLRGRVTQLANRLRQREVGGIPVDASPNSTSEPKDADSILFSASVTNRIGIGQTLVVGGWPLKVTDGGSAMSYRMRSYLLVTPAIGKGDDISNGQPLTCQGQMVAAPEDFWNRIGWADATGDTRRSTLAGVLTPEQRDLLLTTLKETKEAILPKTSPVKIRDGERLGYGYTRDDDGTSGALMGVDTYPRIASDSQSVDLEIRPSEVSTNTQIHPFLKPAAQPVLPSAQ